MTMADVAYNQNPPVEQNLQISNELEFLESF